MKKTFIFLFIFIFSFFAFSQETLKSVEEEYYDFLSLQGLVERPTLGYRTLSDSVWNIAEDVQHPWKNNNLGNTYTLWESPSQGENWFTKGFFHGVKCKIYGPDWFNSYNTAFPYGQNDGALWQGRGYNTSLSGGVRFEGYGFELTFKPMICWSENREFEYLPGVYGDTHSYFWKGSIDLVQRFGDDSYWTYDWNDSEIRWNFYNFTIGFGFQSPWLGPAQLNPMLGSNNAPSYPKFDFGIRKTKIKIPFTNYNLGYIEGRFFVGKLTESEYFDLNSNNNSNILYAFNFSFAPSFINGLSFGITKICNTKFQNRKLQYLNPFYHENDLAGYGEDQKLSVYTSYLIPQVNFEIFAEVGIDDYTCFKIPNPFHTLIWTIGLKKKASILNLFDTEFFLELNNNEMSQDFQLQWPYMGYYSHSRISQGYTQKGQIIGNGFSYAGNSQLIGLKIIYQKGQSIIYYLRNSPDNNYTHCKGIGSAVTKEMQDNLWARFKTYATIAFNSTYFLNNSISLTCEFSYSFLEMDKYIAYNNLENYRFVIEGKFNF